MYRKVLVLLIMLLILTGCTNTLKCNIKIDDYSAKVKIKFKNKKPFSYKFKDIMEFDLLDENINWYYNLKNEEYKSFENYSNIKKGKDYVSTKINYKFNDNKISDNLLLINKNDKRVEILQKIESLGYKCK